MFINKKNIIFSVVLFLIAFSLLFVLAEGIARLFEVDMKVESNLTNAMHPELGWLPAPERSGFIKTREFTAHYTINAESMNDAPIDHNYKPLTRIIALGDSHTYAIGVSVSETWPNILEKLIFKGEAKAGTVYNLGVTGYSLGQYLIRMRSLEKKLDPDFVIIGFSMATDLFDLIPPERGGFVYGANKGRIYFDLDENGNLVEIHDLVGKKIEIKNRELSLKIRSMFEKLALYRRFKRSNLAVWIATHFHPHGKSLWPALDTAMKIDMNNEDEFRWKLAEKILYQLVTEAHKKGQTVILVNIPYLAQVYDEVWENSFGSISDKYDRWIAGDRLSAICSKTGIYYIDSTKRFIESVNKSGIWLHYRYDGHPTAQGHKIIAESVYNGLKKYNLL